MAALYLSVASALIHWYSLFTKQRRIEFIAKPATMVFLIIWFINKSSADWGWFPLLILLGLVLSLGGDIFLMLPTKWFLAGLIAFLLAQIAYIAGFLHSGFTFDWRLLIFAAAILAVAIPINNRLRSALREGGNEKLVIPVLLYVVVISIMVFSACTTLFMPDWTTKAGILVTIGATAFFISDALLAWNRFVTPLPQGRLISIIPYHLAQYFIAFGVMQQLGGMG